MRPQFSQYRCVFGVGDVRLDNRKEVARIACVSPHTGSDVQLVMAAIDRGGADVVARLKGDFAFVAWDARAQKLIAARDAFGVKPLFYRRDGHLLLFSSRLEPLCGDQQIDADYVADFLIGLPSPGIRTIWRGAMQLEPGCIYTQRGSIGTRVRYWDANAFQPSNAMSEAEAVAQFRDLFLGAVRKRVGPEVTWSQLSGGLDSSSVVSSAQWLHETNGSLGLAGTVTLTDSLGNADERRFSDVVNSRYGVPNHLLRDHWPWQTEHGSAPQPTDEPSPLFPFFERDRRMVELVTRNGGRVLLSGLGSDHYMYGTLSYMADMLARRQVKACARDLLGWSIHHHRSFWHTTRQHVIDPVLWHVMPHYHIALPAWLRRDFALRHAVRDRLAEMRSPRAKAGELFQAHTTLELARVSNWIHRGLYQERLEVRYPFLARDLVEFTLQLPVAMKIRPGARKWILREAMRGILPEAVRNRSQKGGMDARVLWTLEHERGLIDALLRDPLLAQVGCLNVAELRKTVEHARRGVHHNTVHVLSVLALESWLRARAREWPQYTSAQTAA
jgi:asparagine synthase (glutamine-hydrolysing)